MLHSLQRSIPVRTPRIVEEKAPNIWLHYFPRRRCAYRLIMMPDKSTNIAVSNPV